MLYGFYLLFINLGGSRSWFLYLKKKKRYRSSFMLNKSRKKDSIHFFFVGKKYFWIPLKDKEINNIEFLLLDIQMALCSASHLYGD